MLAVFPRLESKPVMREQCGDAGAQTPHRMACARCGYYVPKDSTKGQLLAAAGANEALYEEIPIREEERLALEGDAEAIRQLVNGLDVVPAPDGRTPLEMQLEKRDV
jgi:hypothetical protein